jgi:hypothetical protein
MRAFLLKDTLHCVDASHRFLALLADLLIYWGISRKLAALRATQTSG